MKNNVEMEPDLNFLFFISFIWRIKISKALNILKTK